VKCSTLQNCKCHKIFVAANVKIPTTAASREIILAVQMPLCDDATFTRAELTGDVLTAGASAAPIPDTTTGKTTSCLMTSSCMLSWGKVMADWRRVPDVDVAAAAAAGHVSAVVREAACRPLGPATRGSATPLACRGGCDGSALAEGPGAEALDYRGTTEQRRSSAGARR